MSSRRVLRALVLVVLVVGGWSVPAGAAPPVLTQDRDTATVGQPITVTAQVDVADGQRVAIAVTIQ
jgi:hypothetical protein